MLYAFLMTTLSSQLLSCLRHKNQAAKELVTVLKQWATQTGFRVQFIRTDNGTEFSGISTFCRDSGAVHQKTAPYVHQQNGKIERLNRTLQERARAMSGRELTT